MSQILQSNIAPGFPAIIRTIDSAAVRHAALTVVFAGADPNRQRILRIEHDTADRVRPLAIEYRGPGVSIVDGFPNAARRARHEIVRRIVRLDRETDHAPRSKRRPDRSKAQAGESWRGHRIARTSFFFSGLSTGLRRSLRRRRRR